MKLAEALILAFGVTALALGAAWLAAHEIHRFVPEIEETR